MVARTPHVNEIRTAVLANIDPEFREGIWVRGWRRPRATSIAWVGHSDRTDTSFEKVQQALTKAGYTFECRGKPGTEGRYIVDVVAVPAKEEA